MNGLIGGDDDGPRGGGSGSSGGGGSGGGTFTSDGMTYNSQGILIGEAGLESNLLDEPSMFFIGGGLGNLGRVGKSGFNLFKGKTVKEIDALFRSKGFIPKGPNPMAGKGSYINPNTGRRYYLDSGGTYKKGIENPHVDVHRLNNSPLPKRKFPLGDRLYE